LAGLRDEQRHQIRAARELGLLLAIGELNRILDGQPYREAIAKFLVAKGKAAPATIDTVKGLIQALGGNRN